MNDPAFKKNCFFLDFIRMLDYDSSDPQMPFIRDDSSDNDSDFNNHDPGREVIEKNIRNRLQRIADHTKDELNKVLKRVDTVCNPTFSPEIPSFIIFQTLHNYDNSVQASLIQHGMSIESMSNVEHVADIKELEDLLNDSIAKQRVELFD